MRSSRSQSNSDWCWFVSDKVLKVTSGDVGIHELEKTIGVALLGEGNGDWSWFVGHEVLEVSSGYVGVHKLEEAIGVRLGLIELEEGLGDWGIGVLDQVNEGGSSDVLSVKFTNLDLAGLVLLGPVGSLVINGVVSIIIWETLIKDILKSFTTGEGISDVNGIGLWDSLDHDGKGDVVVIRDILLLISGSLKDGVEGVVSDDLSEGLEGNGLNDILRVGWHNLQGDGLDLIDWDISGLTEGIEWVGLGSEELGLGWSSWSGLGKDNWGGSVVMLVVL